MNIKEFVKTWEYFALRKFLKKEKLYNLFVKLRYSNEEVYGMTFQNFMNMSTGDIYNFSDLVLEMTRNRFPNKKHLVLSQLWRFFIIEELEKDSITDREHIFNEMDLKRIARNRIRHNGTRNDMALKELFLKHDIKIEA